MTWAVTTAVRQELLGHDDASTTMINEGGLGVRSPLEGRSPRKVR